MSASIRSCFCVLRCVKRRVSSALIHTQQVTCAKKIGKAVGQMVKRTRLEVEKDPEKLVKFCCGANTALEGSDPEIQPDSEYPDWLWTLHTDRNPVDLSELDQDDIQYWRRLRTLNIKRKNRLLSVDRLKSR